MSSVSVQKLNCAIKYRAYPTPEQEELLAKTFGCVRFIWNNMLADSERFYIEAGTHFIPTPAKYKKQFPFLKEVDSLALSNCQLDLQGAYQKAFSDPKAGFPNYKSKKKAKRSYTTNIHTTICKDGQRSATIYVAENAIRLPKVGMLRIKKHRGPKNGWRLKSATVSMTRSGKYFVSVLYEFEEDIIPIMPTEETSLGLDYSSHDFYTDSNGHTANYPRYYRLMEDRLAKEQRKLARMQPGSKNYEEQHHKITLIHEKIANQRKNFCHTLSAAIAKQYDAVFVEDINLRGMAGSLKLGKPTNDNGFGMFRSMLEYKLHRQGKTLYKVNRFFPSSQLCSNCGVQWPGTKDLSVRQWKCPHCGKVHDRDHNAAINILRKGFAEISNLPIPA